MYFNKSSINIIYLIIYILLLFCYLFENNLKPKAFYILSLCAICKVIKLN